LQKTAEAAMAAVRAARAPIAPPDRRARLVLIDRGDPGSARDAAAIQTPWIADAVARLARDAELAAAAAQTVSGLTDSTVGATPWHGLALASDGRPAAAAAASAARLMVVARAEAGDLLVPVLVRAIAGAMAPRVDRRDAEIVPIADAQLTAWTREPGPAPAP